MALMCSKPVFLKLFIKNNKHISNLLESVCQTFVPAVNYVQDKFDPSRQKLSRAMEDYLQKSMKYDEFLKEQLKDYELGKKFLAGMMGNKGKEMTETEIDEAIEYLFPSALFNKHARPSLKEPEKVFEKNKPIQFDLTGRPFHFLYYTCKPNYSQVLHDAATKLLELQQYENQMKKAGMVHPENTLSLSGDVWLSQSELERKLLEKLHVLEYENFLELFTRLIEHPFSYLAEDMIQKYRKKLESKKKKSLPAAVPGEDGIMHIRVRSSRKTSIAFVNVSYPGSGKLEINSMGLDYFLSTLAREQKNLGPHPRV